SGIAEIDALTGGLPRGALTEIFGAASSGRTSMMLSALAEATRRQEVCALVDAGDSLYPESAAMDLRRLLWIRCGENPPLRPGETKAIDDLKIDDCQTSCQRPAANAQFPCRRYTRKNAGPIGNRKSSIVNRPLLAAGH